MSLARSTQRELLNDVDLIVVFDDAEHPDWGQPGHSAADTTVAIAAGVLAAIVPARRASRINVLNALQYE